MWVDRIIASALRALVRDHPVVGLVGPRQAGKTSLLRRLFPDAVYLSLDEPGIRALAIDDPQSLVTSPGLTIFDEIQALPELLTYVKLAVDRDRRPGRFVLTGSQNLLVNARISESLAGRAVYATLLPFDCKELSQRLPRGADPALKSAFPEPFLHPSRQDSWLTGYAQSYVQRDLRQVAEVTDLRDFERFLRLLALRNGTMLNVADLARDVSVAPNTIKRWLSILEASYQVFTLEPYGGSEAKRVIKTPKVYFTDPAFAWHQAGGPPRDAGAVLEAFVVAAVQRWATHTGAWRCSYYRTKEGVEVDLVLEPVRHRDAPITAIEIKHTATFTPALLRGLKHLGARAPEARLVLVSNIADPPPAGSTTFCTARGLFELL